MQAVSGVVIKYHLINPETKRGPDVATFLDNDRVYLSSGLPQATSEGTVRYLRFPKTTFHSPGQHRLVILRKISPLCAPPNSATTTFPPPNPWACPHHQGNPASFGRIHFLSPTTWSKAQQHVQAVQLLVVI